MNCPSIVVTFVLLILFANSKPIRPAGETFAMNWAMDQFPMHRGSLKNLLHDATIGLPIVTRHSPATASSVTIGANRTLAYPLQIACYRMCRRWARNLRSLHSRPIEVDYLPHLGFGNVGLEHPERRRDLVDSVLVAPLAVVGKPRRTGDVHALTLCFHSI